MEVENKGRIVKSNGQGYKRESPGVNFSTDFMTDEEIASMSGEVVTYYIDKGDKTK